MQVHCRYNALTKAGQSKDAQDKPFSNKGGSVPCLDNTLSALNYGAVNKLSFRVAYYLKLALPVWSSTRRCLRRTIVVYSLPCLFLLVTTRIVAQTNFGFVNNVTSVPVPGVGHDYIHDLNEIVNPANGSVSIRIEAPRPKERGLNYPFYSFMY